MNKIEFLAAVSAKLDGLAPADVREQIGFLSEMIDDRMEEGITEAEAVELIKLSSRRYAKRQLTWFRHNADARRIFVDGEDGKMKTAAQLTNEALAVISEFEF